MMNSYTFQISMFLLAGLLLSLTLLRAFIALRLAALLRPLIALHPVALLRPLIALHPASLLRVSAH